MRSFVRLKAADGQELDAYRALPEGAPRGGVVVIQEIFGVNSHVRDVCERYAEAGYAVIAPALFDRVERGVELDYSPESTPKGRGLRAQIGWDAPLLDIEAAIAALRPHGKVAAIGFCWGGSLAFLAACRSPIDCAVAYYGGQIIQFARSRPRVPVLMHFGESDELIPAADREKIAAAQPEAEIHVYPAGHGFNCDQRGSFAADSAALAEERTLAFLARHLAA